MKSGSLAPTLCVGVSISALYAAMGWDAERPKRERERERLGKKLTVETQFSIWVHLITHMSQNFCLRSGLNSFLEINFGE